MIRKAPIPVFFHFDQLKHRPLYEWAFGEKLAHPETTNRANRILHAIRAHRSAFDLRPPRRLPLDRLATLHSPALIRVLKAAAKLPPRRTFYPSVFPRRDQVEGDARTLSQAGYYCFDSGTPLTAHAWKAAYGSAASAHSAADLVARGKARMAYSLSRPPGHHASRDLFGGYCYFNNAAIAAHRLRPLGRVAIVDIDFHHGNGTQSLFYRDNRVFFASIHGDPHAYYPFFSGYESEVGSGPGRGYTLNVPLPGGCDGAEYRRVLATRVLPRLKRFRPDFLVVSAGFDTFKKDPIGDFTLETPDFALLGEIFAGLKLPTVVVQEGGYATDWLGENVATFLMGFRDNS